jgi:alpha-N-arabinofuranosidase
VADSLLHHEFFRHSDMVGLAVATGAMGTLANDSYGDAIGFRMEGLVTKLLHDHFAGALPVAVNGDSPQVPTKGTVAIDNSARPSGSPTYPLDVFAALRADRKKMAISVVNPTETPQECNLSLVGVQAGGPAKVYQLTAPPGATPVPAGPGRSGFGGPPAAMAESSLPQAPRRIALPPASVTVYELDLR